MKIKCKTCNKKINLTPYRITQDNSYNNLITLCSSCHVKEEHKYYEKLNGQMELNFLSLDEI